MPNAGVLWKEQAHANASGYPAFQHAPLWREPGATGTEMNAAYGDGE